MAVHYCPSPFSASILKPKKQNSQQKLNIIGLIETLSKLIYCDSRNGVGIMPENSMSLKETNTILLIKTSLLLS